MDTQMLIGAKFEAGTETDEKILNPKTGDVIVDLPEASLAQVEGRNCMTPCAEPLPARTRPCWVSSMPTPASSVQGRFVAAAAFWYQAWMSAGMGAGAFCKET